jgi:predicted DNA-binding protein (UPF0251 family)
MTDALDSEADGPELAVDTETPETILMNRSNSQLVQRAIDDLPVHYRETLLLCEVEEMSYQEIAEILSIPIGTVMSRLARARKAVRESLGSTPFSSHPDTRERYRSVAPRLNSEGCMINAVKFAIFVLALATGCLAQEGLTIDNKHKDRVSTPEAEQIYSRRVQPSEKSSISGVRSFRGSKLFWAPTRTR